MTKHLLKSSNLNFWNEPASMKSSSIGAEEHPKAKLKAAPKLKM